MHRRLAFLEYLNDHPEEAHSYAELKKELAARYRKDRESYTRAKRAFVDRIIRLAGDA